MIHLSEAERIRRIGEIVLLGEVEQRLVKHVAAKRQWENERNGVVDKKCVEKFDPGEVHLQGYGAEVALNRMFNTYPDMTTHSRSAKQDLGDFKLPCGLSVDVKTTKYRSGKLIGRMEKAGNTSVNLYALMIGEFPQYKFVGFMTRSELIRPDRIKPLGDYNKPCYQAEQSELKELVDIVVG